MLECPSEVLAQGDQRPRPQLARHAAELPRGEEWAYEPKWDGFRALAFVASGAATIISRSGRELGRYFPELTFPAGTYALDGEIVVLDSEGRESFDELQTRLHPADSRIDRLAAELPAAFMAFDLLAEDERELASRPLSERRARLEAVAVRPLGLTPQTTDRELAETWLTNGEGVVAKRLDAPYTAGRSQSWLKVKRMRTADCVVMGWREGSKGGVGSLVLGLHDEDGELCRVGHVGSLPREERQSLPARLRELETGEIAAPEESRWSASEREWRVLRPELVLEVSFDQASPQRIRHGARFVRWRPDREPSSCGIDQLA